jgi:hypothetical protein
MLLVQTEPPDYSKLCETFKKILSVLKRTCVFFYIVNYFQV